MSRLPNDCFAAPAEMILVDEAISRIEQTISPIVEPETTSLENALGRILAEDIMAPLSIPPEDNSAVDGYAFSFKDYQQQPAATFSIAGRSAAGTPFPGVVESGGCAKIFTGGLVPNGTDTIAMLEDCTETKGLVHFPKGLMQGANIRKTGEDVVQSEIVLKKGTRLRSPEIARIASLGLAQINCYAPLTIGLFSTGDELKEPGDSLQAGHIFDSNRYLLRSLFQKLGVTVRDYGIIPDNQNSVRGALQKAADECHMIVTSGGISVGDEDHVKQAVSHLGSLEFWRIAIKPGRPVALGTVSGTAFLGLPGNPVSAMVCAVQFGFTIARRLMGQTATHTPPYIMVPAGFEMKKKPGRREWLRGKYDLTDDENGQVSAFHSSGSGLISSLTWANGLIEIPEEITDIKKGMLVRFIPFGELFE